MVALHEVVQLSRRIKHDQSWYDEHRVPPAFRDCHPLVLARASLESDGDWFRCVVDDDLSITVYNYRVWAP